MSNEITILQSGHRRSQTCDNTLHDMVLANGAFTKESNTVSSAGHEWCSAHFLRYPFVDLSTNLLPRSFFISVMSNVHSLPYKSRHVNFGK